MASGAFDGVGPFADNLTAEQRGKLALRLTKACKGLPQARSATAALGSLFDSQKRSEALGILNGMPASYQRHILSRFDTLSRQSRGG